MASGQAFMAPGRASKDLGQASRAPGGTSMAPEKAFMAQVMYSTSIKKKLLLCGQTLYVLYAYMYDKGFVICHDCEIAKQSIT